MVLNLCELWWPFCRSVCHEKKEEEKENLQQQQQPRPPMCEAAPEAEAAATGAGRPP